jgi:hypothetical protein
MGMLCSRVRQRGFSVLLSTSSVRWPVISSHVCGLMLYMFYSGVSIVAHCLSRRVAVERLSTLSGLSQLSIARGLLLLILLDSWLFLITGKHEALLLLIAPTHVNKGGMVIFGVGLESSDFVCSLGIYLCIVFYSTSKALIYFFLGSWQSSLCCTQLITQQSKRCTLFGLLSRGHSVIDHPYIYSPHAFSWDT